MRLEYEYSVLDGDQVENTLARRAREGWRVHTFAQRASSTAFQFVVLLERPSRSAPSQLIKYE